MKYNTTYQHLLTKCTNLRQYETNRTQANVDGSGGLDATQLLQAVHTVTEVDCNRSELATSLYV
jgi:hypothetical protein